MVDTNWLNDNDDFISRHIGVNDHDLLTMLKVLGCHTLEDLINKTIPDNIQLKSSLNLAPGKSEYQTLAELKEIANQNQVFRSFIGMGYHNCITPTVIQRNILENPAWFTQYTPYQPEISQGRLEALLNFQTMIMDLTGLEIANASLLDEGTAAAEAMTMCYGIKHNNNNPVFWISNDCHPQTIDVVKSRAIPLGINVVIGDFRCFDFQQNVFAVLLQYPNTYGNIYDYQEFSDRLHQNDTMLIVAADLLSLTLLKSPGEFGADIVVGNTQRFGVPLGYGGPHAAYFATKEKYARKLPGRLVGVSKDVRGEKALRLTLQTREQHIRRDKATSNICTAQVLLAIIASMYAVYHGAKGLKQIATKIHKLTVLLSICLDKLGYEVDKEPFFDTLKVTAKGQAKLILQKAVKNQINLRFIDDDYIGISLDETTSKEDVINILEIFANGEGFTLDILGIASKITLGIPEQLQRKSEYLTHPIFNSYHSETELLRYMQRLQNKDLSLTHAMIPLGSCTMKLNATTEMIPITWPQFAQIHPFVPIEQTKGYQILFDQLSKWLAEITGFDGISLQPNAGAQGEYAGLLVIREYHHQRGEKQRNICLIPNSAHGTNPASAVMAGMEVIVVNCDDQGNIDVADLRTKAEKYQDKLAALMITYPSTHGVFEATIKEICEIIHKYGGQVYMDGANMNAQVGLCRPSEFGADVCHLNLHKTFCIPHGGGGPGMGPIGVKSHLVPYLPTHSVIKIGGEKGIGAIASAPWSSASILPISWAYIVMMGNLGLKKASKIAILNANYIAKKLESYYPVLYKGNNGFVAHECILDLRQFKKTADIDVDDIAKRLIDYGFHPPTVSWPVPGTIMIEPTESESKQELDRFCDAMIAIRKEIQEIEEGKVEKQGNVLKNAPHTIADLIDEKWSRSYSREKGVYPGQKTHKFFPSVGRIDQAYGDRNLVCSCPPISDYN